MSYAEQEAEGPRQQARIKALEAALREARDRLDLIAGESVTGKVFVTAKDGVKRIDEVLGK